MERLRKLREDKGLRQREISNLLHCSQTTYSRYETGELNIPVDVLEKLALCFETSVDYIIGLTDAKEPYERTKDKKKVVNKM